MEYDALRCFEVLASSKSDGLDNRVGSSAPSRLGIAQDTEARRMGNVPSFPGLLGFTWVK
jgi:hypothetical protein